MTGRRHLVGEPQMRGEQLDHVGCPRIVASNDERGVAPSESAQVVPDMLDRLEIEHSLPPGVTEAGRGQLTVDRDHLGGRDDVFATKRRVRADHVDGDAVAGVPSQLARQARAPAARSACPGNTDRAPAPTRHARSRHHREPGPRCSDRDRRDHGAGATGAAPSGRRCPRRSARARCRGSRTSRGRGHAGRVGSTEDPNRGEPPYGLRRSSNDPYTGRAVAGVASYAPANIRCSHRHRSPPGRAVSPPLLRPVTNCDR